LIRPPAAPALAVVIPLHRCETCRDTGRGMKPRVFFQDRLAEGFRPDCTPHFDFATRRFVNCGAADAGEATAPTDHAPVAFDRAAHCERIGQTDGLTTFERYGTNHYRAIGKTGYRVAVARHGVGYVAGILAAKGWTAPRKPDLLSDLAAGRALADLDRAA